MKEKVVSVFLVARMWKMMIQNFLGYFSYFLVNNGIGYCDFSVYFEWKYILYYLIQSLFLITGALVISVLGLPYGQAVLCGYVC